MKMILTPATTPDEYIGCLTGWQRRFAEALRNTVRAAAPDLQERLKWGQLVYFSSGPVLILRAEPTRVLFGFMRGQRLRHIEPRLKPGGASTSWPPSSFTRTLRCARKPWCNSLSRPSD